MQAESILIKDATGICQVREMPDSPLRGQAMGELPVIPNSSLFIQDGISQEIKFFLPQDDAPGKGRQLVVNSVLSSVARNGRRRGRKAGSPGRRPPSARWPR